MSFIEVNSNDVIFSKSKNINVTHAFTTRFGGVSSGIYSSLNLGQSVGDEIKNVKENYARLCKALGILKNDIVCSKQIHGKDIRIVSETDKDKLFLPNDNEADGLVTNSKSVTLAVFTADCVPILLFDPIMEVIGAVHAGWRGTSLNIAANAVETMSEYFGSKAENIRVAIGPCISACCFETDADVANVLPEFSIKIGSKYKVDLKEANNAMLKKAGVTNIVISDECTCCKNDKYWSHRKTKGNRGTQAALISL